MEFGDELLIAIKNGVNAEEVKSFVEDSDFHLSSDAFGRTLLHYSAYYDNIEITQYLLARGSYVDAQDHEGCTPLMMALKSGADKVIPTLMDARPNFEIINNDQQNALTIALENLPSEVIQKIFCQLRKVYITSEKIAQRLIHQNCKLYHAVYSRDARIIEYMLERGVAIEPDSFYHTTALHTAVYLADVNIVRVLLTYGADVQALDDKGANPLFYLYEDDAASDEDRLAIVQSLLERKVSLTSCTRDGYFQAGFALVEGNREVVRAILQSIVDFTVEDHSRSRTLLHYIAENIKPGIVEELKLYIEKFNVNASDNERRSPLYSAIRQGNVDMARFLLDQGVETYVCTFDVYVIYDPKLTSLHDECAEILFQYNANPQQIAIKNHKVFTIFDFAIEKLNSYERINIAIAQLAILEKRGVMITQLIRSKLKSHQPFEKYFEECRRLLDINIYGTVTVFKLLTASKRKLVNYLNNEDLVMILLRMNYTTKIKHLYRYYYNTLKKRVSDAFVYKTLRDIAAGVICKLVDNQLDQNIIVIEKIVDYLDEQNLWQLCKF